MIIVNSNFGPQSKKVTLNFDAAISLNLTKLFRDHPDYTFSEFIETIIQFAEQLSSNDPVLDLSDHLVKGTAQPIVWKAVLSLIPEVFRDAADKSKVFCTRNIRK